MKKASAAIAVVSIALILIVTEVLAGGWAVITLKSLPENVIAGEKQSIAFTVRNHGQERAAGFEPLVFAEHAASGETLRVQAYPLKRSGDYGADLVFPLAGEWNWGISYLPDGQFAQTMPALTVSPDAGTPGAAFPSPPTGPNLGTLIAGAGALALFGGAILYVSKPSRAAVLTAGAGVIVLAGGLLAAPRARALAGTAEPEPALAVEWTDVERGKLLFQAKGCIVCHNHVELREGFTGITTDIGPDLSYGSKRGREFLVKWLADPAVLKPETFMPDLELSDSEIDALAAFIMAQLGN